MTPIEAYAAAGWRILRVTALVIAALVISKQLMAQEAALVLPIRACLVASPNQCKRVELPVESCNSAGIAQIAIWAAANPEWRVERWSKCEPGVPA
jgi:hypothetical protein